LSSLSRLPAANPALRSTAVPDRQSNRFEHQDAYQVLCATTSRTSRSFTNQLQRAAFSLKNFSFFQQATSNKQQATSNKQQATSNKQQATSNKQQATSNKQQATTSNKQQATSNKQHV
jgi:hypothetical protein